MDTNEREPNLGTMLRDAARGRCALFAVFNSGQNAFNLASATEPADARARAIYYRHRLLGENAAESEVPIGTALHFSDDVQDIEKDPGDVDHWLGDGDEFRVMKYYLVKLSVEDADFLLGALPDNLIRQTVHDTQSY